MVEHLLRVPGTTTAPATLGRFCYEIVGFLADALIEDNCRLFVASPYWSRPNALTRAAAAAATWTGRLADTTVVVASKEAAARVLRDLGGLGRWRPSAYVCPGLHAKMVLAEGSARVRALIGSANMTAAGMRRAFETVLQVDFTPEAAAGCGLAAVRDSIMAHSAQIRRNEESGLTESMK